LEGKSGIQIPPKIWNKKLPQGPQGPNLTRKSWKALPQKEGKKRAQKTPEKGPPKGAPKGKKGLKKKPLPQKKKKAPF